VNSETSAFYCHACHFAGLVQDLVADVQQVSRISAERWLRDTYGVEFGEPVDGSMVAETDARFRAAVDEPERVRPPESWLSSVRLDWYAEHPEPYQQYMLDRGLSSEILTEFDCGYDYLSDRLTIPARARDGSLFGIKGRAWEAWKQPRFLVLGDRRILRYGFDTYNVGEVVFGLHRQPECSTATLVEGELDAIGLAQMGIERPIATGSANMTLAQARLIVSACDEVVILFDPDAAGRGGVEKVVGMLEPYVLVRVADSPDVDPCDALRYGREDEVLDAIGSARSSLARRLVL